MLLHLLKKMKQALIPKRETLSVDGKMSYAEENRAWNIIRLKQNILIEFPQLKLRREKFSYKMVMYRTYEELKKAIEEMEKNGEQIPILFSLYKEVEGKEKA